MFDEVSGSPRQHSPIAVHAKNHKPCHYCSRTVESSKLTEFRSVGAWRKYLYAGGVPKIVVLDFIEDTYVANRMSGNQAMRICNKHLIRDILIPSMMNPKVPTISCSICGSSVSPSPSTFYSFINYFDFMIFSQNNIAQFVRSLADVYFNCFMVKFDHPFKICRPCFGRFSMAQVEACNAVDTSKGLNNMNRILFKDAIEDMIKSKSIICAYCRNPNSSLRSVNIYKDRIQFISAHRQELGPKAIFSMMGDKMPAEGGFFYCNFHVPELIVCLKGSEYRWENEHREPFPLSKTCGTPFFIDEKDIDDDEAKSGHEEKEELTYPHQQGYVTSDESTDDEMSSEEGYRNFVDSD